MEYECSRCKELKSGDKFRFGRGQCKQCETFLRKERRTRETVTYVTTAYKQCKTCNENFEENELTHGNCGTCKKHHQMLKHVNEMIYRARRTQLERNRKRNQNLEFNLTSDDVIDVIKRQNKRCVFTGEPLLFCSSNAEEQSMKASIDRLDNSKGYTKDNIQIVWMIANFARNIFEPEIVYNFCIAVTKFKFLNPRNILVS